MAISFYGAYTTTGETDGAVDSILQETLADGDICMVADNTEEFYMLRYNSTSAVGESSPWTTNKVIAPKNQVGGVGEWVLLDQTTDVLAVLGTMAVTGTSAFTGNVTMAGSLNIGGGVAVTQVEDNDSLGTSDVKLCTQGNTKAYVDSQVTVGNMDQLAGWSNPTEATYSDTDTITLAPARYHHDGTTEQILKWDAALTYDFGSGGSNAASTDLGGSEWHYLYIDDSALSGATVTAARILNSTTAPTWTDAKLGYYNGNDMCIHAFKTKADNTLRIFTQDGNRIAFDDSVTYEDSTTWGTSWTDITLSIPLIAANPTADILFIADPATQGKAYGYWRTNGSSGVGHRMAYVNYQAGAYYMTTYNTQRVTTDSAGLIEVKMSSQPHTTAEIALNAYYLPRGVV